MKHARLPEAPELEASSWADARFALLLAASRILGGIFIAHMMITTFPVGSWFTQRSKWISGLLQWDSGWYIGIANSGYAHPRSTVFFPGYPLAIHLVHVVSFSTLSTTTSALVIAWAAFIAAVLLVQKMALQLLPRPTARFATVLFAWSPASIFLISAYPEGLFVALAALALFLVQKKRLWAAAIASGVATAVSPLAVGVACAVGIAALLRWRDRRWWFAEAVGLGVVSISGLLAYSGWLWSRFNDPLEFVHQQATFNRVSGFPFSGLFRTLLHMGENVTAPGIPAGNWYDTRLINVIFNSIALILFVYFALSLVLPKIRRFPIPFSLYAAVTFLIPAISSQMFYGIPNPEAGTRLTGSNLGLYPSLALAVSRREEFVAPFLCMWVAVAFFVQAVFSNGFYFT